MLRYPLPLNPRLELGLYVDFENIVADYIDVADELNPEQLYQVSEDGRVRRHYTQGNLLLTADELSMLRLFYLEKRKSFAQNSVINPACSNCSDMFNFSININWKQMNNSSFNTVTHTSTIGQ